MAGNRRFGDRLHRAIVGAGVVFSDPHDQPRDRKSGDAADVKVHPAIGDPGHVADRAKPDQQINHQRHRPERQDRGSDEALVERAHDRLIGAELHEEGADDGGDDAGGADGERQRHHVEKKRRIGEEDRGQHHGGNGRHRIGLEQVGRHASAVADIVADVVGNGRRVARIVFRDTGFDLADEIAANVGALGEDAAAETGEDRDQRGAEAERHHGVDHRAAIDGECRAGRSAPRNRW